MHFLLHNWSLQTYMLRRDASLIMTEKIICTPWWLIAQADEWQKMLVNKTRNKTVPQKLVILKFRNVQQEIFTGVTWKSYANILVCMSDSIYYPKCLLINQSSFRLRTAKTPPQWPQELTAQSETNILHTTILQSIIIYHISYTVQWGTKVYASHLGYEITLNIHIK